MRHCRVESARRDGVGKIFFVPDVCQASQFVRECIIIKRIIARFKRELLGWRTADFDRATAEAEGEISEFDARRATRGPRECI
jgi:hypothetical protein